MIIPLARYRRSTRRFALGLTAPLFATACVATPPAPVAAITAAHVAIASAEHDEAGRYAPDTLAEARTKLDEATTAVTAKKMLLADRLANESSAEAELASARTALTKAQAVNAEMQRSNGTLLEELQRNAGATP